MNRIAFRLAPLAIAATLFAAGCAEHPSRTATPAPVSSTATGGTSASSSTQTRTSTATPRSSAQVMMEDEAAMTGIPACDDYLASYKGCHRAAQIYAPDTIDQHYRDMHDSLLKQSKDPATRDQLAARCTSLANSLKQALHGKACEPEQPADASSSTQP
jgi:hypothetical protein